jgi:hypothetical protein
MTKEAVSLINPSIREPNAKVPAECRHCDGGFVFEPTEDELEDRALPCKCERGRRVQALLDLDMHHSSLERLD